MTDHLSSQFGRPNQQYQSTEGGSCKGKNSKTKKTQITHAYTQKIVDKYSIHSKSPSLQLYGVTRGRLPQRAGLPGLNSAGAAAAVHCII